MLLGVLSREALDRPIPAQSPHTGDAQREGGLETLRGFSPLLLDDTHNSYHR